MNEIKNIKNQIERKYRTNDLTPTNTKLFNKFLDLLNQGKIRAAQKNNGNWIVNNWVKKGILYGFKLGKLKSYENNSFIDKDTLPTRKFKLEDKVRLVPGGSAVRSGSYIAPSVIMMPPMYVNIGAYVDENSMIDSHALVGSCAQVGKNVHLSAGSVLGGVLEPINAKPVIIEDNVFIGGNCGIFEGIIIRKNAIIGAGVNITLSTPIYDAVNARFLDFSGEDPYIPENAVVVPGSRSLKESSDISIYCPVIIKYRDDKSDKSVKLERNLRS